VTEAAESDDIAPTPRPPPRALGIGLAIVAASCLLVACFSHRWLANKYRGDLGYSPLSYCQCNASCATWSNFQMFEIASHSDGAGDRMARVFPIAGAILFAALLAACAGLVIAAAIATANRHPELPVSPTTIALLGLMIGLLSGCVFVAAKPGALGALALSWSFWLFGFGVVTGIAATHLLARQIRPADPDLLHDAMNLDQF
jgi:hypothetical protein